MQDCPTLGLIGIWGLGSSFQGLWVPGSLFGALRHPRNPELRAVALNLDATSTGRTNTARTNNKKQINKSSTKELAINRSKDHSKEQRKSLIEVPSTM